MKSTWLALALALLLSGCVNYEKSGDDAVRSGDYDVAIEFYENAVVDDPGNPLVKKKLADTKVRGADDFFARGQEALARRDPNSAINYLSDALSWDRRPEIQAALDEAKALLKVVTAERFAAQGHEYLEGKGLTQAKGLFRKALNHDGSNASAQEGLARVTSETRRLTAILAAGVGSLKAKKWTEALGRFNEVLAGWSDNADAVSGKRTAKNHVAYDKALARARAFEKAGDWENAWNAYAQAQQIFDSKSIRKRIAQAKGRAESVALTTRGAQEFEGKALTRAKTTVTTALKLYPRNRKATDLLARVNTATRQAAAIFKRADAARLGSRWSEALDLYQGGLAIWGDHPQAAAHLNACRGGRDHDVEIANGDGAFAQANWDLAIQHYQAAAGHMQSELAASRIQRAQNFSRCEGLVANAAQAVQATRLTEAQALLTKALKLNPDHAHAASLQGEISGQQALVAGLFKRANAAQKANRWDEGLDLYVAAQRLWSDNDSVLAGLAACTAGKAIADGDAAASQSNWADAAKHYGEALEHANTPATQKAFAHANYMGHFGDGEAHEHAGETQSALEAYQRAAAHEATPEVMRRIGALEQILQHEQEQVGPPGQH